MYQNDLQVGKIWAADLIYLPRSAIGFRYCLTLVERVTSYLAAVPLKTLNSGSVSQAMRLFLSIMPAMDCIVTDHGVADFGSQFATLCESLGIEHGGSTPRRSQAQGNIEVANRIFQNSLAKQCATANGRKTWEKFLPRSVQVINSFYPYKSRLSRVQLLMSPFYFCVGQL